MWTADVYLLMSERPDIWPVGDIALQAAAHGKGLEVRPDAVELTEIDKSGGRGAVSPPVSCGTTI